MDFMLTSSQVTIPLILHDLPSPIRSHNFLSPTRELLYKSLPRWYHLYNYLKLATAMPYWK